MSVLSYRFCAVPFCTSTTTKNPEKLFIHVPKSTKRREKWLSLARRKQTSSKSTIYFCEDHFDLPNDMENYMQYRVMGSVQQIRMKPNCLPVKLEHQRHRRKPPSTNVVQSLVATKLSKNITEQCEIFMEGENAELEQAQREDRLWPASTLNGSDALLRPTKSSVQVKAVPVPRKHPAPPLSSQSTMMKSSSKPLLPKPHVSIVKTDTGIILQWKMPYNLDSYEPIASYQLFVYQVTGATRRDKWRKLGDVKALTLPMSCTLTQFAKNNTYYFVVRSIDVHKRIGAFSDPQEVIL